MARRPAPSSLWFALASFAVGIAVGLVAAWAIWPAQVISDNPAELQSSYKDDYIRMISAAYQLDGNLPRAKQRLSQLGLGTPSQTVSDFALRDSNRAKSTKIQVAIQNLVKVLGSPDQEHVTSSPSRSGSAANIFPTVPAQPLQAFRLVQRVPLSCLDEPNQAHLRFFVRNSKGNELPNIGIEIRGSQGDETVYTGLKPERGIGYADLEVAPDTFSVSLVNASLEDSVQVSVRPAPPDCSLDRGATPRGWKIILQQK